MTGRSPVQYNTIMPLKQIIATFDDKPAVDVPLTDAVVTAVLAALQPPAPPYIRLKSGDGTGKDYGFWAANAKGDRLIQNTDYQGFGNGIAVQLSPGKTTMINTRVRDSFGPADTAGQGLYANECGDFDISGSYFGNNGRPSPQILATMLRHNIYLNGTAGSLSMKDSIIKGAASSGLQHRNVDGSYTLTNCVLDDNAIGVLSIMGRLHLIDCVILGGHFQWVGSSYNANSALVNYWPVELTRTIIAAVDKQFDQPVGKPGLLYPSGGIVSGGGWNNKGKPVFVKPPAGEPLVVADGCTIAGYGSKPFAGASPHDGKGFTVLGKRIVYDPTPQYAAYLANEITAASAIEKIREGVSNALAA